MVISHIIIIIIIIITFMQGIYNYVPKNIFIGYIVFKQFCT
jgi:hypothetical protein